MSMVNMVRIAHFNDGINDFKLYYLKLQLNRN